jgi:hypothetical protein
MNLPGGTHISPITLGAIVATCAAPAITLNVWPRVETMLSQGLTSNELGTALLVGVSALAMTTIPFAMAKAPNRGFWLTSLTFGISLGVLNYIMAVGAIGKVADHATAEATAQISRLASLKDQLEELRAARRELGAFRPTTHEALRAADEAVKLAEVARSQECDKVGDHCRARVAQLSSRLSERAELAASLALSSRAREIDDRSNAVRKELVAAGAVPLHTNPQAERIKSVVRWVYPSVATDQVASGIIHFLAIMSELFAFLGPRVLATALARGPAPEHTPLQHKGSEILSLVKRPFLLAGRAAARGALSPPKNDAGPGAQIFAGAILPAPRSAPAPSPIRQWRDIHLTPAHDNRLRTWDAYQSFTKWAKPQGVAMTFTAFDYELQLLGVKKEDAGGRSFYLNVQVTSPGVVVQLRKGPASA